MGTAAIAVIETEGNATTPIAAIMSAATVAIVSAATVAIVSVATVAIVVGTAPIAAITVAVVPAVATATVVPDAAGADRLPRRLKSAAAKRPGTLAS